MRILFVALGITLLFLSTANAQKAKAKKRNADYIITTNGDTTYCVITVPFFGKDVYTTADTSADIRPDEIKEYYKRDKKEHYLSVYRPDEKKPVFIKALEVGKINLLEELIPMEVKEKNKAIWYIGKGSNKVVELRRNKLAPGKEEKNDLEKMLMDNADVYKLYLQDKKFTFEQARSLIRLYNTGVWMQGWTDTYDHK